MKISIFTSVFLLLGCASDLATGQEGPARTGQGKGIYQVVRGWGSYPEGMKFGSLHGDMTADSEGNVYLSAKNGIHVFGPDGTRIQRIMLPFEKPSNLHFGGPENRTIYITEHDTYGLWTLQWDRPGQPQYCDR